MNKVKIEFFHDVICSFCFPMSYRMRRLKEMYPDIQIIHRSFALVKDEKDFEMMFGSRINAKDEILNHWEHANQNDDLGRFKIDAMRKEDFLFPVSMKPLTACKAAYFVGGDDAYWDLFDALQSAFFEKAQNIEDVQVIEAYVKKCNLDYNLWKKHYESKEVSKAVVDDFKLASNYGIHSVPSLVINEKEVIRGALPLEVLIDDITSSLDNINELVSDSACSLNNGVMECN